MRLARIAFMASGCASLFFGCGGDGSESQPSAVNPSASSDSAASAGGGGTNAPGAGGAGGDDVIDECTAGTAICAEHATCVDTPGFYECVCEPGFEGDGVTACEDIDECQTALDDCPSNATCENTEGSFSCLCPAGFVLEGTQCAPRYLNAAAGYYHACAIRSDKTLWCWGLNTSNQIGTGLADPWFTKPVSPSDATDWLDVSLGEAFSCGLSESGAIACWGSNAFGNFGDGSTSAKSTPSSGGGGDTDWLSIDAGRRHVCAVKSNGKGFCWGANGNGQLGHGSTANASSPVEVSGARQWLTLSAGAEHSCGVTTSHALYCWGLNSSSQLGDGTTTARTTPVPIGNTSDWATVDAGGVSTCAVKMSGERWCWGANGSGQLGDGLTSKSGVPKLADSEHDWGSVVASEEGFGCGFRTDGRLFCWGDGSMGQTGQPAKVALTTAPVQVGVEPSWLDVALGLRFACGVKASGELVCWGATSRGATGSGFVSDRLQPWLVGDASDWTSVSVHTDSACGLRGTKLYCWGRETNGLLGDGMANSSATPAAIDVDVDYQAVSVGKNFACGVTIDGDVRCWGSDGGGQLGNGSGVTNQATPGLVASTAGNSSKWTSVAAGELVACGLRADKTLWCWGTDNYGQVGNGDGIAVAQHTPVQVAPSETADWATVSSSGDAVCAIRTGGKIWCWGRNNFGQQGDGSTTNVSAPSQVGAASYTHTEAGRNHVCAIAVDGGLWCWGRNTSGELGLGSNVTPWLSPTRVGDDTDWTSVHLGPGAHGCARKANGGLYCSGLGAIGQLGQGDLKSSNLHLLVPVPWQWKSIGIGNEANCAVRSDGRLLCWGGAASAQLGDGVPILSAPTPVSSPL